MQESNDIRYFLNDNCKFDVRAVLVLLHQNEIFARMENHDSEKLYILPGGAIKFNEESKNGAYREAKEELDLDNLQLHFAGILENFWNLNDISYHQLNIVYRQEVDLTTYQKLQNLDYQSLDLPKKSNLNWIDIDKIQNTLQPTGLIKMCHLNAPIQHLVNHQIFGF